MDKVAYYVTRHHKPDPEDEQISGRYGQLIHVIAKNPPSAVDEYLKWQALAEEEAKEIGYVDNDLAYGDVFVVIPAKGQTTIKRNDMGSVREDTE